ncbi:hypothetical protein DLAC_02723 [Tieghemostelium lacteum]|uniref:Phage tail collar domain-containing protein n=1 Tax=Tieghemostelium lacteum TaxID=361077 RepID=A0A152A3A6_TIELA|nr:hypothetical protein DLAC_02723 [Tieghemostelium lacteum]|eukprot:KYR00684.1 hypothetical protein DLAC_02723 [Tieghemostelium lacteum]
MEPTESSSGSGSLEALKESSITIYDELGNSLRVFESTLNQSRMDGKKWDELKYYVAPQCVLFSKDITQFVNENGNYYEYDVTLVAHNQRSFVLAKDTIQNYIQSISKDSTYKINHGTVSRMTHNQVYFIFQGLDGAYINPIGKSTENLTLNDEQIVTVFVPRSLKTKFENKFKNRAIQGTMGIQYTSKSINIAKFQLSTDEIEKSTAYKNLKTDGSQFVSASQVQDIMDSAAQEYHVTEYRDPGVPSSLAESAKSSFDSLLEVCSIQSQILNSRENIKEINDALRKGTGLSAEQFQPITTMWDISDELTNTTNSSQANKAIKDYVTNTSNKDRITTEVSAGYGPFSAKAGYEKEMTQSTMSQDYFESENQYNQFMNKYRTEKGVEPRFTSRGLSLIEKSSFESNIKRCVTSIAYYPIDQMTSLSVPLDIYTSNRPPALMHQGVPGTIVSLACDQIPFGFLPCDGSAVSKSDYKVLYTLIGDTYGKCQDIEKFLLPNLMDRSVIGSSAKFPFRSIGGKGTVKLSVDELPSHSHTMSEAGKHTHKIRQEFGAHPDRDNNPNAGKYSQITNNKGYAQINIDDNQVSSDGQHTHTINATGGGKEFSIQNPYISLKFVIKF